MYVSDLTFEGTEIELIYTQCNGRNNNEYSCILDTHTHTYESKGSIMSMSCLVGSFLVR